LCTNLQFFDLFCSPENLAQAMRSAGDAHWDSIYRRVANFNEFLHPLGDAQIRDVHEKSNQESKGTVKRNQAVTKQKQRIKWGEVNFCQRSEGQVGHKVSNWGCSSNGRAHAQHA
jgi:hypothetical protein